MKYFDWKKEYNLFYQNPYCTICQKLHNENEPVNIYPNISEWYNEDNEGKKQCRDGSERKYYKSFMTDKYRAQPDITSGPEVRRIFKIRPVRKPDVFLPGRRTFKTVNNRKKNPKNFFWKTFFEFCFFFWNFFFNFWIFKYMLT